jgi:hypothetical protein
MVPDILSDNRLQRWGLLVVDDKDDVRRTLKYGSERFLIGQIPLVAIPLLLGLTTQVWPSVFPWQGRYLGAALALASAAFILFALFRRFIAPGAPRLVLSPDGIHQRLSHGRILHIPWDEVQAVVSVDQRVMNIAVLVQTILKVPAVVVSKEFYERAMPVQPWLRRPLNWGHFAESGNGGVRILFRAAFLGTRSADLRQAIEARWRAFSRHPNAKLPPRADEPSAADVVPSWLRRWLPAALMLLAALPAFYFTFSAELSEGSRSTYLAELLDKGGVAARLADGRMVRLHRSDVAAVGIPECPETTRSESWIPSPAATASCTAVLTLPSRERAMAVFRLVSRTETVEYRYGKFRQQSWLVTAPLSLEEADALLCRLGHCGAGTQKK